jgi:anaerobic selenocysteine-containing dehydrogenase
MHGVCHHRRRSSFSPSEISWDYACYSAGSAADMLAHAKLIVLWGFDPAMGSCGPGYQFAWFLKLARERRRRVIIIDPRYTVGAQVLADQWIPIKPGTDTAMYLAMAYVLFKEDLWDKGFVDRYVEPVGFSKWKDYVLGKADGKEFNPKMLFWGGGTKPHASDHLVTACEPTGAQVEAMERMEFIVTMHSQMTASTRYADIILPARDWMWEEKNIKQSEYGGFECINYCPGVVDPPGEVRPWAWWRSGTIGARSLCPPI